MPAKLDVTKSTWVDRAFSMVLLLPFAVAIGYLHEVKGVPFKVFLLGSGSWGFGCIGKLVLYHGLVCRLPHDSSRILGTAAINGLVSGVTELGAAIVFFALLPALTFWEVVGFGIGIGAIEALLVATNTNVFKGTALEQAAAAYEAMIDTLSGASRLVYRHILPISERILAAVIHVGTRGLTYVAYHTIHPLPLLVALAAFLLADGILGYRWIYQGRLRERRVLIQLYAAIAALAAIELVGFLFYWPDRG